MLLTQEIPSRRGTQVVCRHCGTPIADPRLASTGFCCSGCAYVNRLVHEHGLGAYYRIKDPVTAPADAAVFQPRDYGWLREAQEESELTASVRIPELSLDIQGVSCAGCVWLIERLFMQERGAREIVVNAQHGSVRIRWFKGMFDAPGWAQRLQAFGYLLGPAGKIPSVLESTQLAKRVGLCGAFALNVMLFALPTYFGMRSDFEFARLFGILALVFATLSVMVGGSYFIGRALAALRSGALHIDLPIAIGIVAAYASTLCGWLFGERGYFYPDFVATFIVLMLVGRWAQVYAVERNRQRLLRQQPVPARIRLASGGDVGRDQIEEGQVLLLGWGDTVPVEGMVEQRESAFSMASITGEAEPQVCRPGQRIPAGAVSLDRAGARLRALETWERSLLAKLLAPAERAGPRHRLMERVVTGYIVGILGAAALTGALWAGFTHSWVRSGAASIAVLVVSCPCAIGLALPLVDEMATASLRRDGVFVREAYVWSKLGKVRKVIFDKTGTLTLENPVLLNPSEIENLGAEERRALLALVRNNLHPVGRCLHEGLLGAGAGAYLEGEIREEVGRGVSLGPWSLGSAGWRDRGTLESGTVFARGGEQVARFLFRDSVRPGAAEDIADLERRGYAVHILSGDRADRVSAMALSLGLPDGRAVAEVGPEEKAGWIARNASDDALMLGDGANDSLAFDRALCRGTPVIHRGVLESKADFYYLRQGIGGVRDLLRVGRVHRRVQRRVIAFSVAYNLGAAGLAAAGLVNPLVAAVLMPASSLVSLAIVVFGMRTSRLA
jgi:Cu2+-exporting ATPase